MELSKFALARVTLKIDAFKALPAELPSYKKIVPD